MAKKTKTIHVEEMRIRGWRIYTDLSEKDILGVAGVSLCTGYQNRYFVEIDPRYEDAEVLADIKALAEAKELLND